MIKRDSFRWLIILIGLMGFSCSHGVDQAYVKTLKPQPLAGTKFEVSIPDQYQIIKNMGPDYDIFYVLPVDTANKKLFTAGMYLGNHPSSFGKSKSGCSETKRKTTVLETESEWTMFDCNGAFFTEVVVQNKYSSGGDEFIHAFGNGSNKEDLEHVFAVFSTLKKGEQVEPVERVTM